MNYFGIMCDKGAIGMNDGCKDAPIFLMNLFKKKGKIFDFSKNELEELQELIEKSAKEIFSNSVDKKIIFGGTHDITGFLFKAFSKKNKDSKLLIFDAHVDCEDAVSITTHEDFVRMLIKQKIVEPKNLMIVGLRDVSEIEKEFLLKNNIKHFYYTKLEKSFDEVLNEIKSFINNSNKLYVSFDVDFLSDTLMKATGYFPKSGATKMQTKQLIEICFDKANVFDLVEFNSNKIKNKEDLLLDDIFGKWFL